MLVLVENGRTATREFWFLAAPLFTLGSLLLLTFGSGATGPGPGDFVALRRLAPWWFWTPLLIVLAGVAINSATARRTVLSRKVPLLYYISIAFLVVAFFPGLFAPFASSVGGLAPKYVVFCGLVYMWTLDLIQRFAPSHQDRLLR